MTAFALMRTPPPAPDAAPPSLRGVIEGLRYAASRQELLGSYLIDINAMFFGMPFALFPALADRYGGTQVVGLLWAAPGVGALVVDGDERLGGARAPQRARDRVGGRRLGRVHRAASGSASTLWLALLMLALAGAADGISGIFRGALWNETIPDACAGASRAWR